MTQAVATVIAAGVSGLVSLGICLLTLRAQNRRHEAEVRERDAERDKAEAVRDAENKMWMRSVDKKLDIHNGYAEKFGEISRDIAVIKNDIKTLYKKGD